ncbi:TSCPD domain-containing protein [Patescibacteria group bacterium]|nr:TSCPD domain-containing protein [Patescibacteria group bacterium]
MWVYLTLNKREEYRLSTGYLKKLVKELGLDQGKKVITKKIEKTSRDFYKGLLMGFFDADGSVQGNHSKGVSIRLSQSNLQILKAVQRMLIRLGIFSKIYANRRNGGKKELPDGKDGLKEYHVKPQHELAISNENILYFYKRIGFGDLDKMKKLENALRSYKRKMNRERFITTVKFVAMDGVEEVYDVQIPKINAFDANGLYVHNCGEQPLLPYESCNLGSINLAKMVEKGEINWDKLKRTIHIAVHFLDNVIDANKYPLPRIAKNTKANRKIGLGIMGFADMLISLSTPYDSKKALNLAEKLMSFIQDESKKASEKLAEERGTFPNFEGSKWEKEGLKLRNATTTTIAPTGSISMIANCSSGVEPLFSILYHKQVLGGEKLLYINEEFERIAGEKGFYSSELLQEIVDNKGSCQQILKIPPPLRKLFVTALDISFEDHIKMQASFQKYTDNAVSKTINFPNRIGEEEVKKAFILAYKMGCKGITVYRDRSREEQVIKMGTTKEKLKKELTPRSRGKITYGTTREMKTGCGDLYVTINEDKEGNPFEVFAQLGKSGGCAASQTEAIGRLVSLSLRSGILWKLIVKQLKGISCDRSWGLGKNKVLSCADAVAKAIEMYQMEKKIPSPLSEPSVKKISLESEKEIARDLGRWIGACPQCGSSAIEYEGGCFVCKSCGYTECE